MLTVPTLLVFLDVETVDNDGLTFSYSYPLFLDHSSWVFVMTFRCEDLYDISWNSHSGPKISVHCPMSIVHSKRVERH